MVGLSPILRAPDPRAQSRRQAAVVTGFTEPLQIQDRDVPVPGAGQVLVRIETSGLCHTDIHAAHGDWPVKPTPPFVPGHEGVGIIEALGEGVTHRAVGDRVALPWLGHACGHCDHCVRGWETLCEEQQNTGYSIDGGFAEYAVADATYVVPVPDGVTPFDAAPLTCAGDVINAGTTDPGPALEALGGADVAIVLAVIPSVFETAFAALRRGGRLVCVGLPPETEGPMALPIFPTVLKGISVIGSIVGTRQDLTEVFELHARGRTRVIADTRKLDEVNEAIDDVLAGRAPARIVFEF